MCSADTLRKTARGLLNIRVPGPHPDTLNLNPRGKSMCVYVCGCMGVCVCVWLCGVCVCVVVCVVYVCGCMGVCVCGCVCW